MCSPLCGTGRRGAQSAPDMRDTAERCHEGRLASTPKEGVNGYDEEGIETLARLHSAVAYRVRYPYPQA